MALNIKSIMYFLGLTAILLLLINPTKSCAQVTNSLNESTEAEITEREFLSEINLIYQEKLCFGENGSIELVITDGIPPYDFLWNTGATTQDLINVPPGNYEVTVTDGTGTEIIESATLIEMPYLGSQIELDIDHVSCSGGSDGAVSVDFINNTSPYSFDWSNGATSATVSHLSAGIYNFTVTDRYWCEFDTVIAISEPNLLVAEVNTSPASCHGGLDGMAWVEVTGGVPPDTTPSGFEYYYNWPIGINDDSINIAAGNYTLTVSDANGCQVLVPFTVEEPTEVIALDAGDRQICIGGETTLSSQVTGGTSPYFYYWVNSETFDTVYSNNITVSPTETTSYFFYAKDDNRCKSNIVSSTVNVFSDISVSSIDLSTDSVCKGEPITIDVEIQGGNGGPYQIVNENTGQIVPPSFTIYPQESNTYTLQITDACSTPAAEIDFEVTVMPNPPIGFIVDKHRSCPPGVFSFNEFSPDIGQSYHWNFGDGGYAFEKNPVHTYTETGVYDVSLTVTSDFGCTSNRVKLSLIRIDPKPDAEFYVSSNNVSILNPIVQFFNVSADADSIFWFYGDGDSSLYSHSNPRHEFDAVGIYNVKMVAENRFGCIDTTYKNIRVHDEYTFSAPNAFTPNNDGINDCFRLCGHGVDEYEYHLWIYDRLGSIVYETEHFENDLNCDACGKGSWDGTYNGSYVKGDELCEPGEYVWVVKYTDVAGVDHVLQGRVTLVR